VDDGPLSFVVSAVGLYFMLPPRTVSGTAAIIWRIAAYAVTMGILALAVAAWLRVDRRSQRPILLLAGAIASTVVIAVTAATGRYWPAGEAWAMLAPMIFVVLVSPLFSEGSRPLMFGLAAVAVVGCHLAMGFARPIAAADESGLHFGRPYPGVQDADAKSRYDWDLHRHDRRLASCTSIGLDIDDRFLERVVGVYLTDKNRRWESTHPDRVTLHARNAERVQPLGGDIDCVFTTGLARSTPERTSIPLSMDRRLETFLYGDARSIEIAVPVPAGIEVSGVHGIGPKQ
jgi:hypothetical protein